MYNTPALFTSEMWAMLRNRPKTKANIANFEKGIAMFKFPLSSILLSKLSGHHGISWLLALSKATFTTPTAVQNHLVHPKKHLQRMT